MRLITRHRRGTTAEWLASKVIPSDGELIIEECSDGQLKLKIGDGGRTFQQLPYVTQLVETQLDNLQNQLNTHIAYSDGELEYEYPDGQLKDEILNARITYDEGTKTTLGEAIRSVGERVYNLESGLSGFINGKAVNDLHYENNTLYLVAGGEILTDTGVKIVSGSGGDGDSSQSKMTMTNTSSSNTYTLTSGKSLTITYDVTSTELVGDELQQTGSLSETIIVNEEYKITNRQIPQGGQSITIPSDWFVSGPNKIEIRCTDIYGASKKLVYTANVVELRLTSTFEPCAVYDSSISFYYTAYGSADKVAHFILKDGTGKIVHESQTIPIKSSGTTSMETIPFQNVHGIYTLEVYLTAEVTGQMELAYSNTLHYDVLFILPGTENSPLLSSSCDKAEIEQGDSVSVEYFLYDPGELPANGLVCTVQYMKPVYNKDKDGNDIGEPIEYVRTTYSTTVEENIYREKQTLTFTDLPKSDNVWIMLDYEGVIASHALKVTSSTINVQPIALAQQLYLTASGKTNKSTDRSTWSYISDTDATTYTTKFSGFNWDSNGWVTDSDGEPCLRLNGDAQAVIQFEPFNGTGDNDILNTGKTIEIEFAIRNVNSRDAVAIQCHDGTCGFKFTADTALFESGTDTLEQRYDVDKKMRLSIVIDSSNQKLHDMTKYMYMYINGTMSCAEQYSGTFTQDSTIHAEDEAPRYARTEYITIGSPLCEIDVYSIRVYRIALTPNQIVNNYVADLLNLAEKKAMFVDNALYENDGELSLYGEQLSYKAIRERIPTITLLGKKPKNKGEPTTVRMIYENPFNKKLNFDESAVELDIQGTSSVGYPRKNWKIKLPKGTLRQHMDGELPARVFCIKVDYAEGTGTHNTQNANFVETLYDRTSVTDASGKTTLSGDGWLLPHKDDLKVRTTISGVPSVLFHVEDEAEVEKLKTYTTEDTISYLEQHPNVAVFSSKCNFNYDKGAENVFGFTDDYDTECWEFCNNDHAACKFLMDIQENVGWIENFEARYYPSSKTCPHGLSGDEADALDDLIDLYKENPDAVSTEQIHEITSQGMKALTRFREMHHWVVSTNTDQANGKSFNEPITIGRKTFTNDTAEYRLAKFTAEFENYFDLHYATIYYLYTLVALMTDQRAKNMFLTYWEKDSNDTTGETGRWYPYFYDNDTSFGIDNVGHIKFEFYHEDIDTVLGNGKIAEEGEMDVDEEGKPKAPSFVYNGQESTLWQNFRKCFYPQIRAEYQRLRGNDKLTFDKLNNRFVVEGSDSWSASIYNEDAEYKYLALQRPGYEGEKKGEDYLYQVRGTGEHHFSYFAENRLKYCDSKYYTGDYPSDNITVRIYTPQGDPNSYVVKPSPAISITPYSDMYAGVRYKANGLLQQKRYIRELNRDEDGKLIPVTFSNLITPVFVESEIVYVDPSTGVGYTAQSIKTDSNAGGGPVEVLSNENVSFVIDDEEQGKITFTGYDQIDTVEVDGVRIGTDEFGYPIYAEEKILCCPITISYYGYVDAASFNDTETFIYGASEISSLGDLSALYCGSLKLSAATKLTELYVGNSNPRYSNTNLTEITFGSNVLLRKVNIENCPALTGSIDMSKCINIEEIHARGTSIKEINLPSAGNLKVMRLPNTISTLIVRNQPYIEEMTLNGTFDSDGNLIGNTWEDYANITRLWIENSDLPTTDILNKILEAERQTGIIKLTDIRIDGINLTYDTGEEALAELASVGGRNGIDDEGKTVSGKAYLLGELHINNLTGEEYLQIKELFPYLKITFDSVVSQVTFMNTNSVGVPDDEDLHIDFQNDRAILTVYNPAQAGGVADYDGVTCIDPLDKYPAIVPIKAKDDAYTYAFVGWSTQQNAASPDPHALDGILGDRVLYPVFGGTLRYYKQNFYTGDKLIYHNVIGYGESAIAYSTEKALEFITDPTIITQEDITIDKEDGVVTIPAGTPIKQNSQSASMYYFTGFLPASEQVVIRGDTNFYADFTLELDGVVSAILPEFIYHTLEISETDKRLYLDRYIAVPNDEENDTDSILTINPTYEVIKDGVNLGEHTVYSVGGFSKTYGNGDGKTVIDVEYVDLPDTVKEIQDYAFKDCNMLTHIEIGENVERVGRQAFSGCNGLSTVQYNAISASTVSSSDYAAFVGAGRRTSFSIAVGPKVTIIPGYMFKEVAPEIIRVDNLTWDPVYEEDGETVVTDRYGTPITNCKTIGTYAFYYSVPKQCNLKEGVSTLSTFSFAQDTYHTKITYKTDDSDDDKVMHLPVRSLTTIEDSAFRYWKELETVELPKSIITLGTPFRECPKLKNLSIETGSDKFVSVDNAILTNDASATLVIGCMSTKINGGENGVKTIGKYAFAGSGLKSPDTEQGVRSFIPTSVTGIGASAFTDCTELTSMYLPESISGLGTYVFDGCIKLHTVTFADGIKIRTIPNNAFNMCSSLNNVILPSSVTSIDASAFANCSSLDSISFNACQNLNTIGRFAFRGTALTQFTIPNSVTTLHMGAFQNCYALTTVWFGTGVTDIVDNDGNKNLFANCNNLSTINCPFAEDSVMGKLAPWGAPGTVKVKFNCFDTPTEVTYVGGVRQDA